MSECFSGEIPRWLSLPAAAEAIVVLQAEVAETGSGGSGLRGGAVVVPGVKTSAAGQEAGGNASGNVRRISLHTILKRFHLPLLVVAGARAGVLALWLLPRNDDIDLCLVVLNPWLKQTIPGDCSAF